MIRIVALFSLMGMLVLVLYLPSAHPPDHFFAQLRAEHGATARSWGEATALRILSRALGLQASTSQPAALPPAADAPTTDAVSQAVSREMALVNQRLFDQPYFRSIEALLALAAFRLATLLEWTPWLLALGVAAVVDGGVIRLIKAKEFRQHDPELFALYACVAIVIVCATVVGFVMPVSMPPWVLPCVPVAVVLLVGGAVGSFHRRD